MKLVIISFNSLAIFLCEEPDNDLRVQTCGFIVETKEYLFSL
jgi:hypothetical protein